jgi:hypothetical protein
MDQNTTVIVGSLKGAAGKTSGRVYRELFAGLDGLPADEEIAGSSPTDRSISVQISLDEADAFYEYARGVVENDDHLADFDSTIRRADPRTSGAAHDAPKPAETTTITVGIDYAATDTFTDQ